MLVIIIFVLNPIISKGNWNCWIVKIKSLGEKSYRVTGHFDFLKSSGDIWIAGGKSDQRKPNGFHVSILESMLFLFKPVVSWKYLFPSST